jgi:hypothetical protein
MQVLLRELSRDIVELLRAFVGSTSFPSIPAHQLAKLGWATPYSFGAARRGRGLAAQLAVDVDASDSPLHSPKSHERHSKAAEGKNDPPLNSIAWGQTAACALLEVRCPRSFCSVSRLLPGLVFVLGVILVCTVGVSAAQDNHS